jgi:phage tail sheath gpL-like
MDTQYIMGVWLPDSGTPDYSVAEMAAACANRAAANAVPFNPLDDVTITGIDAPENQSEWPTKGAGLESEACLNQGWTPLFVKPNGEVAFVRTVTGRLSADGSGSPVVTAYYDLQDFQVIYLYRKALYTRYSQTDFKQRKASDSTAREIKSEGIRLAQLFEDQAMFQKVKDLAKFFLVERNVSDRHRFDFKYPVNVVPGLHVVAGNIEAGTLFDTITL